MKNGDTILYLASSDVQTACQTIDAVAVIAQAFDLHARGATVLPGEAYLTWTTRRASPARSIAMPAVVGDAVGVKVINGVPANVDQGLPRASGLVVLLDRDTGRPLALVEGARISSLRTAAVTALCAQLLGAPSLERVALLGAGALAEAHAELLAARLPRLEQIRVYDLRSDRAQELAARLNGTVDAVVSPSAEQAVRGADLVVPVTTATQGYIPYDWLAPGALLVNVSLDDPLPEVVLAADKVFVDDWRLVVADRRRLLGRMAQAGLVIGPNDPDGTQNGTPRRIDGELAALVGRAVPGREHPDEVILVNPFGLAIEDVALAAAVHEVALERGLGLRIPR